MMNLKLRDMKKHTKKMLILKKHKYITPFNFFTLQRSQECLFHWYFSMSGRITGTNFIIAS